LGRFRSNCVLNVCAEMPYVELCVWCLDLFVYTCQYVVREITLERCSAVVILERCSAVVIYNVVVSFLLVQG